MRRSKARKRSEELKKSYAEDMKELSDRKKEILESYEKNTLRSPAAQEEFEKEKKDFEQRVRNLVFMNHKQRRNYLKRNPDLRGAAIHFSREQSEQITKQQMPKPTEEEKK